MTLAPAPRMGLSLLLVLLGLTVPRLGLAAPSANTVERPYAVTEEREPCAAYAPLRRPFFGDLHVHTARSQDASTQDTRVSPAEAYRFARGERLGIQPHDEHGEPLRSVQLERPLDFAAVTDHASQLGEVHLCSTPGATGYDGWVCTLYRRFPRVAFFVMNARYALLQSRWGFCGEENEHCLAAAGIVWGEHRRAAEAAYDRSATCAFTTFVGYEWTAAVRGGAHLHRNVLFRNERVPELPISVMETGPEAIQLWRRLDAECVAAGTGCEAITIPHNSNWSAGTAFTSATVLGGEIGPEEAAIRARYDRLVEVMQHKGDSECALVPGVTDEGCAFEKAPNPHATFLTDETPREIDHARGALKRGLELTSALGTNPLAFGLIASTDTHLGTPGLVAERGFSGHGGAGKPGSRALEPGFPDLVSLNPGGLAVLWAEENTRDALFAAMQRREAYGTSGTRPVLRFFGGWDLPTDACGSADPDARGYASGVPMGGTLAPPALAADAAPALAADAAPALAADAAPAFLVRAERDPHPNGGDLQRIEIVKGWMEEGELRETTVTVAGGPNEADVDLTTCQPRGEGQATLCSVWRDPDFDPAQKAFYYARLLENPSCRWTQWACVDAGVDCDRPETIGAGLEACCTGELPPTIQERAWSSPIWTSGAAAAVVGPDPSGTGADAVRPGAPPPSDRE